VGHNRAVPDRPSPAAHGRSDTPGGPWRPLGSARTRPDAVLELFDHRITAAELASPPFTVDAADDAAVAAARLAERGYAAAPVRGGDLRRVFRAVAAAAPSAPATVQQCAETLPAVACLTADDALPAVLEALAADPLVLVFDRLPDGAGPSTVVGVITARDLDRAVVRLAVLGLVLWLEPKLDRLLHRASGGAWRALLTPARIAKLEQVRTYLDRPEAELAAMAVLNLDDRLTLVRKLPHLRAELGWRSTRSFRAFAEPLRRVRDALAHGGGVLDTAGSAQAAVDLIRRLRQLVARVEALDAGPGGRPVPPG